MTVTATITHSDELDLITIFDAQGNELAADGIIATENEQDYADALVRMGFADAVWAEQAL